MNYFYKGYEVTQIESFGPLTMVRIGNNLTQHLSALEYGTEICVSTDQLQPLISGLYSIGDKVTSVLRYMERVPARYTSPWTTTTEYRQGRKFEGIITSFEPDTNRAVCRGLNVPKENTRKRYAYGVGEIEKIPVVDPTPIPDLTFTFKAGSRYKINGRTTVLATETATSDCVALYNIKNGECLHKRVPIQSFKPALAVKFGIENIQKMR